MSLILNRKDYVMIYDGKLCFILFENVIQARKLALIDNTTTHCLHEQNQQ